ncbi:MAG: magnesium transporter [Chlamydiales bacterium]|nr:magnesium transporter [Chlamydiia bacterium]MCP5507938.1 magnesium transporter [Chlamydiales bacterium]
MRVNVQSDLPTLDLRKKVSEYLGHSMPPLYVNWNVQQAVDHLRSIDEEVQLRYFYVVDDENKLAGVVSSHHLLFSKPDTLIGDVMDPLVICVDIDTKVEEAVRIMREHRLAGLPVVDKEKHFSGIIEMRTDTTTAQSLKERQMMYDDIFQLIGISLDQGQRQGVAAGYISRMPWLAGNLIAGFACAAIAGYFREVLSLVILLAMFIPLVLTLSESISMQAMTLSLVFLHRKKVPWGDVGRRMFQEMKTALLLGVTAGLAVEGLAYLLHGDELPYLVIAISICVSMVISATIGVVVPVLIHGIRLDPTVAAGPVALMFADTIATAVYLGLATWFIIG